MYRLVGQNNKGFKLTPEEHVQEVKRRYVVGNEGGLNYNEAKEWVFSLAPFLHLTDRTGMISPVSVVGSTCGWEPPSEESEVESEESEASESEPDSEVEGSVSSSDEEIVEESKPDTTPSPSPIPSLSPLPPPAPKSILLTKDPVDPVKIVIAIKITAKFCIETKLQNRHAKHTTRSDYSYVMGGRHAAGSFFTHDFDACFSALGMQLSSMLSNAWDETICNAQYAIEQTMDACVKRLIQIMNITKVCYIPFLWSRF